MACQQEVTRASILQLFLSPPLRILNYATSIPVQHVCLLSCSFIPSHSSKPALFFTTSNSKMPAFFLSPSYSNACLPSFLTISHSKICLPLLCSILLQCLLRNSIPLHYAWFLCRAAPIFLRPILLYLASYSSQVQCVPSFLTLSCSIVPAFYLTLTTMLVFFLNASPSNVLSFFLYPSLNCLPSFLTLSYWLQNAYLLSYPSFSKLPGFFPP
jgi:hypothetical protein